MEYTESVDSITIDSPEVQPLKEHLVHKKGYLVVKRLIDIVGSIVGVVLTIPFIFVVGMAIKLESKSLRAKVFFVQERVGKDGKTFKMIKFRSMQEDAEEQLKKLLHKNEIKGAMFKMKNDPRVTKVGKFIRKTSIDELPQFFNVLIGDMSLVGPRPPLMREVVQYSEKDKARLLVKPGITGLWQATVRNDSDFDVMVRLDVQYIREISFKMDMKILFKTISVVFHPNGAY
ncbi:sugar transferase [Enterococcus cecorum]|uniref:sugar transferase n=1 Tax=Enterococcus cecorum TaxID=44008 RepID=UPI000E174EFA|nr:sugar transferase [Enterococcus cecorum]HIS90261.1 sugar transferase [Candidatus Faecisoma merdavium]MCJ0544604.1 sugar transferase [Enterococcus cecorum]MCJ0549139.1 sugar transferase [Enterococcus cecorum]MCJ0554168.1 sugar transferase [Enterococcus cecorum]MCJ0558588.1 sugar transferase [Enterococcus cecorum]